MLNLLDSENLEHDEAGFSLVEILVVGALVIILAGGGFLYFRSQPFGKKDFQATLPTGQTNQPGSELPTPLATQPSLDETTYITYETGDGKFSFEYPDTWTQVEIKNLESVLPKEIVDKNELSMPLIASDPRGAQVILSIYHFEKSMDLDAIMDSLVADAASLGQPYI